MVLEVLIKNIEVPKIPHGRKTNQKQPIACITHGQGRSGERSLTCFFLPDLRSEGEISQGFLGKGKKSIDLESVDDFSSNPCFKGGTQNCPLLNSDEHLDQETAGQCWC